jgi:hypothetical protein
MLEVVHKDQPLVAEEMVADHLETELKEMEDREVQTPEAVDVEDLLDPLMQEDLVDLELY